MHWMPLTKDGIEQPRNGGIVVMANAVSPSQESSIWWVFLLQGFSGLILGFMLLTEHGSTIVAITTLLGFYWPVMGLLALVQVLSIAQRRGYGRF
jgi:uncharacterized membrane protein HdeD (DUF308 family)